MKDDYSDMIGLPHHVSDHHPQMPLQNRAAQFMPFAALRGFDDVIDDRGVLRERRRTLSEDERETLDESLRLLAERLSMGEHPEVRIMLFDRDPARSDAQEEWGYYREVTGRAEKLRPTERDVKVDGVYYAMDKIDEIRVGS